MAALAFDHRGRDLADEHFVSRSAVVRDLTGYDAAVGSSNIASAQNADFAVSTWKVGQLIAGAECAGVDVDALFDAHGIDPAIFAERSVSFKTLTHALTLLAQHGPADLGQSVGQSWHLKEFSVFAYSLLSCRTFGEFTDGWLGHFEYLGIPLSFTSAVTDVGWELRMAPPASMPLPAFRLVLEEACASVYPIYRQLTGKPLEPIAIHLADIDREYADALSRRFGVHVETGMPHNALVSKAGVRASRMEPNLLALQRMCKKQCTAIAPELMRHPFLSRIRWRLLHSCGRAPTLDKMAELMRTSKRTLNRRLAEAGWTYRDMVQLYRRDLIFEILRKETICVKRLAFAMSFDSPESLRRSFRKWTGMTISEWSVTQTGSKPPRREPLWGRTAS